MGACYGVCCPIGRLKRRACRTKYYDQGNLVEFESLMDNSPIFEEPVSVVTDREKTLVALHRYNELVAEQQALDIEIFNEQARREEALELEEEALIEARREAARIARLANTEQIINPARLVFRDSTTSYPGEDDNSCFNGTTDDDQEVFIDENKLRLLTTRTYLPSHSSMLETGSTISSGYGWINNNGSTPPSSIDLEWDEAGVYLTSETNGDKNTTPASNDLEWDNDFEGSNVTELDQETEQLIMEIDRLTANAMEEFNYGYR